tara:strand:+ start:360 stop:500 length:141 start_codon:yes stop_codon:yes gene_type:complete
MNTLFIYGILIEVGIASLGFYLIKQLQKKQARQPSFSKKILKNLKF